MKLNIVGEYWSDLAKDVRDLLSVLRPKAERRLERTQLFGANDVCLGLQIAPNNLPNISMKTRYSRTERVLYVFMKIDVDHLTRLDMTAAEFVEFFVRRVVSVVKKYLPMGPGVPNDIGEDLERKLLRCFYLNPKV